MIKSKKRHIRIKGTGGYLPPEIWKADQIDSKLNLAEGTTAKTSGVHERHIAPKGMTATDMAAKASFEAVERSRLKLSDIQAIICAQAVPEQPIPCNAALLQKKLGLADSRIPCFDVNATCLSFVTALELASWMIDAGSIDNVLIVASEVAHVGLSWDNPEVISLFGDGAAAAVVGRSLTGESSTIWASKMETYSEGAEFCQIKGGGTGLYPTEFEPENREEYCFQMQGPQVFKMSIPLLPRFLTELYEDAGLQQDDLQQLIPHQASGRALTLTQRTLGFRNSQVYKTISFTGNMVAASIPYALHHAWSNDAIKRGDTIMLLGTSAGLSIGGMILTL